MSLSKGVGGLGGGWLSMAPQVDELTKPEPPASIAPQVPAATTPRTHSPLVPTGAKSAQQIPPSHSGTKSAQHTSQSQSARSSTSLTKSIPRTKARFQVGSDSSSLLASPVSSTPVSPQSGDGDDSPPPFDVRASFAPMPTWGEPGQRRASESGGQGKLLQTEHKHDKSEEFAVDDTHEEEEHSMEYKGRKFKGKTANAIELEMEALGDQTVMSYAPDAVYLASRLEGLRRNLEAGGERVRRLPWQDAEDGGAQVSPQTSPVIADHAPARPSSEKEAQPDEAGGSVKQASLPVSPMAAELEKGEDESVSVASGISQPPSLIDPAAKEAALDARVEIRTLRRPDLEQVRELHCYHGDGEKIDTESYTTSAAFLLRLLVDEHYVCLVAVAKPLPEPPSLPMKVPPRCPPPSLDFSMNRIPPSGRNAATAQFVRNNSALQTSAHPITSPLASAYVHDAPAPRSFGVGPDSDTASANTSETSDEERRRQSSLFEAAKAASTNVTGDTSSPEGGNSDDVEMDDLAEDRDAGGMEVVPEEDEGEGNTVVNSLDEDSKHGTNHVPGHGSPALRDRRKPSSSTSNRSSVLAGPTFDVAPPRAIRVMGAPPLGGVPPESETILGVAAARIKVVQRAEDEWGGGSGLAGPAPSETKDSSWPGLDPQGERSRVTREAHILTLSVLPGERGQGLGTRLLDLLIDECKRRTAGPRIHLAPGSNTVEEGNADSAPPRAHQDAPMRTVLETHPSNAPAMALYTHKGFHQVPGNKGIVRHFFRGDQRIPSSIRLKVGGSDAVRLERFDAP